MTGFVMADRRYAITLKQSPTLESALAAFATLATVFEKLLAIST